MRSSEIAYFSGRDLTFWLRVMDVERGLSVRLVQTGYNYLPPAWSPDGERIAFIIDDTEIYVMDADGGNLRNLSNHPAGDFNPVWSPDGRQIAFTSMRGAFPGLYVIDVDGGTARLVREPIDVNAVVAWSADGTHIAFVTARSSMSWVVVIEVESGAETLTMTNPPGFRGVQWLPAGNLLVTNSSAAYIISPEGEFLSQFTLTLPLEPTLSPDGTEIAFTSQYPSTPYTGDIFVMSLADGNIRQLTHDVLMYHSPVWSPDGVRIAFASGSRGYLSLYMINADGSHLRRLTAQNEIETLPAWRP
jgi:TolB protein